MSFLDLSMNFFPGLREETQKELGIRFTILSFLRDPRGYHQVYLILFEFEENRAWGLCIWDGSNKRFIEEPAPLSDYGFRRISDLYKKYPQLKNTSWYKNQKSINEL